MTYFLHKNRKQNLNKIVLPALSKMSNIITSKLGNQNYFDDLKSLAFHIVVPNSNNAFRAVKLINTLHSYKHT